MKIVTLLALLLALVSCSACGPKVYPQQVPTMMDVAVVKLVLINHKGEKEGTCTGFKIDENRIATAGHCCEYDAPVVKEGQEETDQILKLFGVEETETVDVPLFHMEGSHAIPGELATVIKKDTEHDVCILRGKMKGAPIRLAPHDPAIGERIFTAGYPKGTFLISEGIWSGRHEERSVSSSVVWPGASGSPILDHEGRAVGVLVAYYHPLNSLTLIAPLEWLRTHVILAM